MSNLTLTIIAKDEAENLPRLFESVRDCQDEIVVVDTGSTDNTVEVAKKLGARVEHFKWVDDFAAARNYALSKVKTEYAYWIDCDDSLNGRENFIDFKNNALKYFDYVLATYNYALDQKGNPIVSFMRERIFKMSKNPKWKYFIHEGVTPPPGSRIHYCANWSVDHMRTEQDMVKDRSRNLNIFEKKKQTEKFDGRLIFYHGKEFYENGMSDKALPHLFEAIERPDLEAHDRVIALQYACYAMLQETEKMKPEHQGEKLIKIIEYAHRALVFAPNRAEFFVLIGDCYMKMGRLGDAMAFYAGAAHCLGVPQAGDKFSGAIHSFKQLYGEYPRNKMAQIYANLNRFDDAKAVLEDTIDMCGSQEAKLMLSELNRVNQFINLEAPRKKTEDIVFTTPPQTAYTFDEETYKQKGTGGSETALIEMAKWLKKYTGRPVKVFNMRDRTMICESGVEYISTTEIVNYFSRNEPYLHIAWRHNDRLTKAPSYLWCHDLMIPGVENGLNQDKVLTLTPFHKEFLHSSQGVPEDRIILTRNGIAPEKWEQIKKVPKNPMKLVYASSPDRGLDRLIKILDIVRKTHPVELHVYYGIENLYKYGQQALGDLLKKMMDEREWIKYHGFTEQKKMYAECADAALWVHPNDFIETSCITALEMVINGVYPITRRWGGIRDTLAQPERDGWARLLDIDSVTPGEHEVWAKETVKAIDERAWERIKVSKEWIESNSWAKVALEWIKLFDLWKKDDKPAESDQELSL